MTSKIHITDLPEFDMARQLKSEEDIAAFVTLAIEYMDNHGCYSGFTMTPSDDYTLFIS